MMNKEQAEAALRAALEKIASGFVDSLKTDDMKNALGAQDTDSMSGEDFSNLLAERMSILDEEERRRPPKW